MPRQLVLVALAICIAIGHAAAQEPSLHVPSTISEEAQAIIRESQPNWLTPNTLAEWEAFQRDIEAVGMEKSDVAWRKLGGKKEIKRFGGVEVHVLTPKRVDLQHTDKALIWIHGGGYVFNSARCTYQSCLPLADLTGLKVYSIEYRLAPQHPYPAGLDDCVNAYRGILAKEGIQSNKIGMFGISAGGSMILSVTLRAQAEGLSLPGAIASVTPGADMSITGDSYYTLDGVDSMLTTKLVRTVAEAYANGKDLKDPLISPVYAEYSKSFPPTIIQTGTRDLLLSNCVRLHRKMKDAGVNVELSVWEGMWHAFIVNPSSDFPEAKRGYQELADFFKKHLKL